MDSFLPEPLPVLGDSEVIFHSSHMKASLVPGVDGAYFSVSSGSENKGVVVLVDTPQGVVLVKQHRYAVGLAMWELPRGSVDAGETFAEAALREVEEETGLVVPSNCLVRLGRVVSDSGLFSTHIEAFYAQFRSDELLTLNPSDSVEVPDVVFVSKPKLFETIAVGEMWDGLTLSTVLLAQVRGLL